MIELLLLIVALYIGGAVVLGVLAGVLSFLRDLYKAGKP